MSNSNHLLGKASILAIGTELTTGQIINRNAAWISEKLVDLGVDVVLHETVADDHVFIHEGLDHCARVSQFIFVTGGLGPTTDDFTREVVAKWLNQPLEFNEEVWQKIVVRLSQFNIHVAESNRQQSFFPLRAEILPNPQGTAAGFTSPVTRISGLPQQIWVLPGPPHEIQAIWNSSLESLLRSQLPTAQPLALLTWQCVGKSEAELGELTEKALHGSELKTGYRAHRPYVEIKVWIPDEELERKKHWIEKLEKAIGPWILTRQGEDLADRLLSSLRKTSSIKILDAASGSFLAHRLNPLLRRPEYQDLSKRLEFSTQWSWPPEPLPWIHEALEKAPRDSTTLALAGFNSSGIAGFGLRKGDQTFHAPFQSPYRPEKLSDELVDRMRQILVEIAIKQWCHWLYV